MEILTKLFGSGDKVKVMKLFVLNPDLILGTKEIVSRCKITSVSARREINLLKSIGFVKQHKKIEKGKKSQSGLKLNEDFPYLSHLRSLLKSELVARKLELTDRFSSAGKIKLLLVAGVFIQDGDSRADLVLVGDRLKRGVIERAVKSMEAEIGRELSYAVFETSDFLYRLEAFDKFIRDLLDYPHEKVINRLGV